MRPPETSIVEQQAHVLVAGHEPGLVAYSRADPVHGPRELEPAKQGWHLEGRGLFERQLTEHGDILIDSRVFILT
ncbi:hypothetical protein SAMN06265360_11332 [Haloechinothrix alba]|uniref:Uncharacterized protein n=1 Tax=Haloechinothrix alba TaxID=664784 RepID=A0A238Y162_9PSEU|nr:hypothetical protein SAMN06265360_11332 [Haloechinothrix alba]